MANDYTYLGFVGLARAMMAYQGLNVTVRGWENVPEEDGAVVTGNHTGYLDFVFASIPFRKYRRFVRFMCKKEIFDKPVVGAVMRAMKHIPVDRIDGAKSYDAAVDALRRGELVGIFPEATISRSFEPKQMRTGAIRMAAEAGVPIIPVVMFGSQRVWTKGHKKQLGRNHYPLYISVLEPWTPTGEDPEADIEELRRRTAAGLEELWAAYQQDHGAFPEGEFWVPARFGGSAPSPEEAAVADKAIESERYRVRKLSRDLDELTTQLKNVTSKVRQRSSEGFAAFSAKAEAQKSGAVERIEAIEASLKKSIADLSRDTQVGLREGAERVKTANSKLVDNVDELYRQIPDVRETAAYTGLEESLTALVSKVLLIRDSLPVKRQPLNRLPGTVLVGMDTEENFSELIDAGVTVVVGEHHDITELEAPVVYLGYDERKLNQAKLGVTLGDAPFNVLTSADRVIATPEDLTAVLLSSEQEMSAK